MLRPFAPKPTRHTTTLVLIGLLALTSLGCASSRLPPRLSPLEHATVEQLGLPLTVGVAPEKVSVYHRRLIEDLRATGAFEQVELLTDLPDPDLVVELDRYISGTMNAIIPLFSIISFGVIPTRFNEEHGQAFTVTAPGCEHDGVSIDFSYEGKATMGWAALAVNVSRNYTVREIRNTDRYQDGLALAIAEKADQLVRLTESGNCTTPVL